MAVRMTHKRMVLATSFVAGFMLGIGVLHLLPHAIATVPSADVAVRWLLAGFLVMFLLERFFTFHHHETESQTGDHHSAQPAESQHGIQGSGHGRELTWGGAAIGLTLHSLVNGAALTASILAEANGENRGLAGLGVFLVIALHKPFDAMTIGTLMAISNRPPALRHLVNVLFALSIPVGAAIFYVGVIHPAQPNSIILGCAIAFAAGTFLCIAMSDLLPELRFHEHDRFMLSLALIVGLALAWGVDRLESKGHDHGHGTTVIPHQLEHEKVSGSGK